MALQAEDDTSGFSEFHLYVCAAFLVKWSEQLQKMDFQVPPFCPSNHFVFPLTTEPRKRWCFCRQCRRRYGARKRWRYYLAKRMFPRKLLVSAILTAAWIRFLWKSLFHDSVAHLRRDGSAGSGIPSLNL